MDKFTKHQVINLKNHPEYNEKWVQEIIIKDPTILNLGDLVVKDTERLQPGGGRLDLLLYDPESNRNKKYLDGEFWRQQGLIQIIPFWQSHVRDTAYGAFYMYLSRDGKPLPPWDKHPAMISRHVFGFTTAYLLSGNEKYLETASEGVNYLLKYAWDNKYGGWFDVIERMQPYKPQDTSSVSWWIQSYGLFLPLHL